MVHFKKGDRVRCIDAGETALTLLREYTVENESGDVQGLEGAQIIKVDGVTSWQYARRFEPVTSKESPSMTYETYLRFYTVAPPDDPAALYHVSGRPVFTAVAQPTLADLIKAAYADTLAASKK
jgi:hypothetical protein